MNDPNIKIKQQIVDKIKSSTNILVTVSRDPNVDDLSAAVGLTAMLNNMGKHATAIFSGAIPPAISFLEPDKIFEGTADSLRDFIIALDKEKADHLRYKIEGDVVKIFITPYRTTITGEDLQFSQGDFNVELVLALGVTNKDHLDQAIAAHEQIIHDVTIATFSAGEQVSDLGSMDWHDDSASSLSEMVTAISESLKTDKALLDKQISTALLTGIVFATDRFSNTRTTSKVMTMAAQLMAAGADQQLIAAKLDENHEINSTTKINSIKNMTDTDAPVDMPMEADAKTAQPVAITTAPTKDEPGMLRVSHAEPEPEEEEVIPATSTLAPAEEEKMMKEEKIIPDQSSTLPDEKISDEDEPLLGGTLNATASEAEEDNRKGKDETQNRTILSHSYLSGSEPNVGTAINSTAQSGEGSSNVDIFATSPNDTDPTKSDVDATSPKGKVLTPPDDDFNSTLPPEDLNKLSSTVAPVSESSTLSSTLASDSRDSDEARMAVESAFSTQLPVQSAPVNMPMSAPAIDLPMPPPLPDFSSLPPPATPFDYSAASLASTPSAVATKPPLVATEDNPALFKIPGQ